MSKIGKLPIAIPAEVQVNIKDNLVSVKGPKGNLEYQALTCVHIAQEGAEIKVSITNEEDKKYWGLTRTLIANMIEGVVKGYEKKLHIMGVGYGAQVQGNAINFSLGLSHKVSFPLPASVNAEAQQDAKGNTILTLTSIDKQLIGEIAGKIRDLRKPEPYKGKGIRYFGEIIKLKAGKAAKK